MPSQTPKSAKMRKEGKIFKVKVRIKEFDLVEWRWKTLQMKNKKKDAVSSWENCVQEVTAEDIRWASEYLERMQNES